MITRPTRFSLIAAAGALAVVMVFKFVTPEIPIGDAVYMLAGLVGVVFAGLVDWLLQRLAQKAKP